MSLTREDMAAISELLDEKLVPIEQKITNLGNDMIQVKADVAELKSDMVEVKQRVGVLEETVTRHYKMFEEFYVYQREYNTAMEARWKIIEGKLDMHSNQIARNIDDIRLIK